MENSIKLNHKERAMFLYLLKILKNQGDQDYDYDNLIKALQYGFELHYSDVFECLFDEELSAGGTGDRYLSQASFSVSYIKMPLFQQKRGASCINKQRFAIAA